MGRSLPGVSAMPLPFPAQVLTLKLPLARELPQPEKHHPTRSSELPFPDGIAAVAAVGLVVSPKHRELRAESRGSGRRSGSRRERAMEPGPGWECCTEPMGFPGVAIF